MNALSLREAVSICDGTSWVFRRRGWTDGRHCQVGYRGAILYYKRPGAPPIPAVFSRNTILADDYEILKEAPRG